MRFYTNGCLPFVAPFLLPPVHAERMEGKQVQYYHPYQDIGARASVTNLERVDNANEQ